MRLTFVDNLIANLAIKNIGAKRAEFEADLELRNDRQVANVFGVLREAKQMTSYVTFRGEYKDGKLIGSCEELKPGTEYYVWIAATSTGFPEAEGAAHRIYSDYGKFTTAESGSLVIDDVHSTREDYLHVLGKGHAENIPDWETRAYFGNWEKQTESSWESVSTGAGTVDPEAGAINFDFQATEVGHYRLTIMDGAFEHEYVSESYEFDITEPKEGKLIIDDVHQVEGEPLHVYGKGHAQDIEKWEELGYVAHWEKLEDGTWVFAKNTAATNKPEEGIIDFDYRADSIPGGMGEGHYRVSLQEASKTPLYVSDYVEFDIIVDSFRIDAPTFVEPMKPELFEAFSKIVETIDGAVIKDAYFAYAEKGQEPAIKAPAVVDFPKLSVKSTMEYKAGTTITCRFEVVYEYLGETHQAVGDEADYLIPEPTPEDWAKVDEVLFTKGQKRAYFKGSSSISLSSKVKTEAHWGIYEGEERKWLATTSVMWAGDPKDGHWESEAIDVTPGTKYDVMFFIKREDDPDFTKSEPYVFETKPAEEAVIVDTVEAINNFNTAVVTGHATFAGPYQKVEAHWGKWDINGQWAAIEVTEATVDEEGNFRSEFDREWFAGSKYGVMLFAKRESDPDFIKSEVKNWSIEDPDCAINTQGARGMESAGWPYVLIATGFTTDIVNRAKFHFYHKEDGVLAHWADDEGKQSSDTNWTLMYGGDEEHKLTEGETYAFFCDGYDPKNEIWVESEPFEFVYTIE